MRLLHRTTEDIMREAANARRREVVVMSGGGDYDLPAAWERQRAAVRDEMRLRQTLRDEDRREVRQGRKTLLAWATLALVLTGPLIPYLLWLAVKTLANI